MPARPIRADVDARGLCLDKGLLRRRLAGLPARAPVVVMIHGYRFAPDVEGHCPHRHILGLGQVPGDRTAVSWPLHLHLDGVAGLGIGLGWQARGSLFGALARADVAGDALADLAECIRSIDPDRRVDVIAHSLGARVALRALRKAQAGDFGRLILLAAAETRGPALAALASPAGRAAEVVNITSRENDIFDFIVEWATVLGADTALGQGLGQEVDRWLDLQIDQRATETALAALGLPLRAQPSRICHWSPYVRPGVFALYRALFQRRLDLNDLRAAMPSKADRRWSRLIWPTLPGPMRPA